MKQILPALLAAFLLAGCVMQKIDWTARTGHYTYDQAVMEFGPPDKSAKLSDGTTMAEWLTRRGQVVVAPEPYFVAPGCYFGPFTPMYSETYVPAKFLRLTFDTNNVLQATKEFVR